MIRNLFVSVVARRGISSSVIRLDKMYDQESNEPTIPPFEEKFGEPLQLKKARSVIVTKGYKINREIAK